MTKIDAKQRVISLLITLAMLICTLPLTSIVAFATEVSSVCDAHTDTDTDALCDSCGDFLSEPAGSITLGQEIAATLPRKSTGYSYFTFTAPATKGYVFEAVSSDSDPLAYLYTSDGNFVGYNDDSGEGRLFRMVVELTEGVTYYIAVADYSRGAECSFTVIQVCDEHTPEGDASCLGILCAVCGEYYGEPTDHVLADEPICAGTYCSVCDSFFGEEKNPNRHADYNGDNRCEGCRIFHPVIVGTATVGEDITLTNLVEQKGVNISFTPSVTGTYRIEAKQFTYNPSIFIYNSAGNFVTDAYSNTSSGFKVDIELTAGETYCFRITERQNNASCTVRVSVSCAEHTPSETVECLGTICGVCGLHYGEATDNHSPTGSPTCIGTYCEICKRYYGDADPDNHVIATEGDCRGLPCTLCRYSEGYEALSPHKDENSDGKCDVCDNPIVEQTLSVGEHTVSLKTESYVYYKFTPVESGTYSFKSATNGNDPMITVLSENWKMLGSSDDANGRDFHIDIELEAGKTYYLELYDIVRDNDCNVTIAKRCDIHTPAGAATCYGIFCFVCEEYYGDADPDNHVYAGDMTCVGTYCIECDDYFGDADADAHDFYGDPTCLGTWCNLCYNFYGERAGHLFEQEPNCAGKYCSVCATYYGEPVYEHTDEDNNGSCDVCLLNMIPDTDIIFTVGENVAKITSIMVYAKFVPEESGVYYFINRADFRYRTFYSVHDDVYRCLGIAVSDDGNDVYLKLELTAGETYYIAMNGSKYNIDFTVEILPECEEHSFVGGTTCLGTYCSACELYLGDTGEHSYEFTEIYSYGHIKFCTVCEEFLDEEHSFDSNGCCECGYTELEHECVLDKPVFDTTAHWYACSVCGIEYLENYFPHEYDENGMCECGREQLRGGIYIGTQFITDGQYVDNYGNVSTTVPEGGYAYFKDGVLTLNNFKIINNKFNSKDTKSAIHSEMDLTVVLIGENEIVANDDAIYVVGDLTIRHN